MFLAGVDGTFDFCKFLSPSSNGLMVLSFQDLKLRNRKDIDGTPRLLRKGRKGREGSGHTWWATVAGEEVAKWGGVRPAVGGGARVRRWGPPTYCW